MTSVDIAELCMAREDVRRMGKPARGVGSRIILLWFVGCPRGESMSWWRWRVMLVDGMKRANRSLSFVWMR